MNRTHQARPVYIAALPREIAPLVKGWQRDPSFAARGIHVYSTENAVIACAGMGIHRATLAVEAALSLGSASELISVGWAGACHSRVQVGDIVRPSIVIDSKTGERYFIKEPDSTIPADILVTVPKPAGALEKQRLEITYYASAVDMEASAVARIARMRDIPFDCIKAVSDDFEFEIPYLSDFTTPDGGFREIAFGFHIAVRPSLWKSVAILAEGSKLAADNLQAEIKKHIQFERSRRA